MGSKNIAVILLTLTAVGCNDYPGHRPSDPTTLAATPAWGQLADSVEGGDCNIESINGNTDQQTPVSIHQHQTLNVIGWGAISIKTTDSPSQVALALREESSATAHLFAMTNSMSRADVAAYFNNPGAASAGFDVVIDVGDTPTGKYLLEVVQNNHGMNNVCRQARAVTVV